MPIRAVLFDYGLVLSAPPDPAAWARMKAITGLDEARFDRAYWLPRHDYDRGTHTGPGYWRTVAATPAWSSPPPRSKPSSPPTPPSGPSPTSP